MSNRSILGVCEDCESEDNAEITLLYDFDFGFYFCNSDNIICVAPLFSII
jgi:hypothetical protein